MIGNLFHLSALATLVDFGGTLLITVSAAHTLLTFLWVGRAPRVIGSLQASLTADLVTALSVKSGAGLIRLLTVTTWTQLGLVVGIIGLRLFLGQTLKVFVRQTSSEGSVYE